MFWICCWRSRPHSAPAAACRGPGAARAAPAGQSTHVVLSKANKQLLLDGRAHVLDLLLEVAPAFCTCSSVSWTRCCPRRTCRAEHPCYFSKANKQLLLDGRARVLHLQGRSPTLSSTKPNAPAFLDQQQRVVDKVLHAPAPAGQSTNAVIQKPNAPAFWTSSSVSWTGCCPRRTCRAEHQRCHTKTQCTRILDQQQRVVDQVAPAPHLQGRAPIGSVLTPANPSPLPV